MFINKSNNFYKQKYSLEERKKLSNSVLENTSDTYPIVIQPYKLENNKSETYYTFKLRGTMNLGCLVKIISKKENLNKDQSVIFKVNKEKVILLNSVDYIQNLYKKFRDEDGFLYIFYSNYAAYGNN